MSRDMFNIMSQVQALTSDISEVDGLPVGVEQLNDGVVVVLHSAADGGRFPLNHCHIVSCQVLTVNCTTQAEHPEGEIKFQTGSKHSSLNIY